MSYEAESAHLQAVDNFLKWLYPGTYGTTECRPVVPVDLTMPPEMMAQALSMCGDKAQIRPVLGHPGYYVSDQGDVFSTNRGLRKLKPKLTDRGTFQVQHFKIHRAVCLAFHGHPPENRCFAIHKNGNVRDNRADNLFWGGLHDRRQGPITRGSESQNAKVNEDDVTEMHRLYAEGTTQVEIARRYGLNPATIQSILSGRSWCHVYREIHGDKAYVAQAPILTKADVRKIHRLHRAGVKRREIAKRYGMAPCNVYNIVSGRTWRQVYLEMHPRNM